MSINFNESGQWSLAKAKPSDAFEAQRVKMDTDRKRVFDADRSLDHEVENLKEMSAKSPTKTFKPGQKGFPPREKHHIESAKEKGVTITPNSKTKLKKGSSMNKLDELEKALRKYQELLKNAQAGYPTMPGGMTQPTDVTMKAEDEKDKKKKDKKEDEKMIEDKLDEHNEKKHGEPKDEDSAKKSDLNKSTEIINFNNNSQWSIDE